MKKLFLYASAIVIGAISVGMTGCTQTSSSPYESSSVVAVRTEVDNSIPTFSKEYTKGSNPSGIGGSVDSISVTSAAFVASNVLLRSDISDAVPDQNLAEGLIRPEKFILLFDASSRQYVGERIIFDATYRRVRFDLLPVTGKSDPAFTYADPIYVSLFAGTNNTIVIQGYLWEHGAKFPFTYSSASLRSEGALFDTPLIVAGGAPMEVLLRFSTASTFTNELGSLMDPRDMKNASTIDANLKVSVKAVLASGTQ